ncbi:hypothetical protein Y032_0088g2126 [Ancylostoma ceylanicum]|uniref:Uncharacterized protein n=1 Tax=Ancylostoma ceylanicum TaxID=53326 RepID=A0A016TNF8_9BILA|nr:hypothetical protein Y032_0088g2126 [Ancylostoma ceylanicum]
MRAWSTHKDYFYHDSVRPHIARTGNAGLMKFGCTISPLPRNSSNLAYSDYHLFPISNVIPLVKHFKSATTSKRHWSTFSRSGPQRPGAGAPTICLNVGRRPAMHLGHASNDSHLSFKNCKKNKNIVNLSGNFQLNLVLSRKTFLARTIIRENAALRGMSLFVSDSKVFVHGGPNRKSVSHHRMGLKFTDENISWHPK